MVFLLCPVIYTVCMSRFCCSFVTSACAVPLGCFPPYTDPLSQLFILPEQLTATLLLRIPEVCWMAGFTLMVIVWVGIVRAAKGKVMTSKVSGLCSGSVRVSVY